MKILVLNGSPRNNGNTAKLVGAFRRGASETGHEVNVIEVCSSDIHGCTGCEYCHGKGNGKCIQRDGMTEVYELLKDAEMLVLASPIYYHGFSGQLKCAIDRMYAVAYPSKPPHLKKISLILSSGSPDVYEGAFYSFKEDFLGFLGLEDSGILTSAGDLSDSSHAVRRARELGATIS